MSAILEDSRHENGGNDSDNLDSNVAKVTINPNPQIGLIFSTDIY
jgi:hypothetical protein